MKGMAKITAAGNLTKDPEKRATKNGTTVTTFSLAINKKVKDVETVSYFDVVAWSGTGDICAQYLTKGSPVLVSGDLEQQRWVTEGGENRSKVVINAREVVLLGQKQQEASREEPSRPTKPEPETSDDQMPF